MGDLRGQEPPKRPSGEGPTIIGWLLIAIGILATFIVGSSDNVSASTVSAFLVAQLGLGLGVLLVSLGYIARAIWFLPGRDIPTFTSSASIEGSERCDWCGQQVSPPKKPCSLIDPVTVRSNAPNVANIRCREALAAQGFDVDA